MRSAERGRISYPGRACSTAVSNVIRHSTARACSHFQSSPVLCILIARGIESPQHHGSNTGSGAARPPGRRARRRGPFRLTARSMQDYYTFPDVALCSEFGKGCLDADNDCFDDDSDNFFLSNQEGFTDNYENFADDHQGVRDAFEAVYPACVFIPLSKLNVDIEGVRNRTVTALSASFYVLWSENGEYYNHPLYVINQQFLDLYLLEADAPVESFEGSSVDAKVPYARVNLTTDTGFEARINHMVLGLTEFIAINENGNREEKKRSFAQTTTTGIENWWWNAEDYSSIEVSILMVEMSIGKFEFTSIEEVDPVDIWSIIGAIGGIWQFVVTGFGLFFVFSEKQPPDRKMRNFRKSVAKPAIVINRHLSSASGRASNQDIEIDATAEDLPVEWVKKQRRNGSMYYFNVLTGVKQSISPHEIGGTGGNDPALRDSVARRAFKPAHNSNSSSQPSGAGGLARSVIQESGARSDDSTALPPGWKSGRDDNGRPYYMNTVAKTTQWEHPARAVLSTGSPNGRLSADHATLTRAQRTARRTGPSSARPQSSSSSGEPRHHRNAGAADIAASPPAGDAPPPPLGHAAALPSYRTLMNPPNTSTAVPASASGGDGGVHPQRQDGERQARASRSSAVAGAGGRSATTARVPAGVPLPPNWGMKVAPNNNPYYVNSRTKTTQWEAPHA